MNVTKVFLDLLYTVARSGGGDYNDMAWGRKLEEQINIFLLGSKILDHSTNS